MMKAFKFLALCAWLFVLAASHAFAGVLYVTPDTLPQWTGEQTSQAQINAAIAPLIGGDADTLLQYKQDAGSGEAGPYTDNYTTTFSGDLSAAEIVWDGLPEPWINKALDYLLVKDGNHDPAWYLFNLVNWNGRDTLSLSGFWPLGGAISHVSLYGRGTPPGDDPPDDDPPGAIPEPSSLALAIAAAFGCFLATKRRKP
jgi:hypothetical protein